MDEVVESLYSGIIPPGNTNFTLLSFICVDDFFKINFKIFEKSPFFGNPIQSLISHVL